MGDDAIIVAVKAVPRSRQTRAVGVQDGALRVQIAAPPHKGQSNAALCAYLAKAAGVKPRSAGLRRGSGGARKLIEIRTSEPAAAAKRLATAMAGVG